MVDAQVSRGLPMDASLTVNCPEPFQPVSSSHHETRRWRWEFDLPRTSGGECFTRHFRAAAAIVCRDERRDRLAELSDVRECEWLYAIEACNADPGHVYFIYARDLRRVKIGFSRDVASRFTSLRNSSPCDLLLIGSVRTVPPAERAFHRLLNPVRRYGEWFDLTDEVGIAILAVQTFGQEGSPWA